MGVKPIVVEREVRCPATPARARTMRKQMNDAMRALKLSAEKFRKIDKARFAS